MLAIFRVEYYTHGSLTFNPTPMWSQGRVKQMLDKNEKWSLAHYLSVNTFDIFEVGPNVIFPKIQLPAPGFEEFSDDYSFATITNEIFEKATRDFQIDWLQYDRVLILVNYYQSGSSLAATKGMAVPNVPVLLYPVWFKSRPWWMSKVIPATMVPISNATGADRENSFHHEFMHTLKLWHIYDTKGKELTIFPDDTMGGGGFTKGLSAAHFFILSGERNVPGITLNRMLANRQIVKMRMPKTNEPFAVRLYALDFIRESQFPGVGRINTGTFLYMVEGEYPGKYYMIELRRIRKNTYDQRNSKKLAIKVYSYDKNIEYNHLVWEDDLELPTSMRIIKTKWTFGIIVTSIVSNSSDSNLNESFVEMVICGKKYYKDH